MKRALGLFFTGIFARFIGILIFSRKSLGKTFKFTLDGRRRQKLTLLLLDVCFQLLIFAILNLFCWVLVLPPLFFPTCVAECAENEETGMGGGAEMSNEQSMELHPYSPGPAPLLVPEEGENDLLRAVAPFLRGEVNHNIPVQDQTPQAGASPVDESISDSEEDESSGSSSYEVSVSEDESVDESIPQYCIGGDGKNVNRISL